MDSPLFQILVYTHAPQLLIYIQLAGDYRLEVLEVSDLATPFSNLSINRKENIKEINVKSVFGNQVKNCSVFHPKFLLVKSFCLRSNIKHSTQCFITRWNISKFVKNNPLHVVFSTFFSAVISFLTGGRQSLDWWRHYDLIHVMSVDS